MAAVVEAACPGCKRVLRIPAEWMHQAIRCKHCGLVVSARPAPAPTRTSAPARQIRSASPALPIAIPVASVPPAAGNPQGPISPNAFANLDGDTGTPSSASARRRRRGRWRGLVFVAAILIVGAVLTALYWPKPKELAGQATPQIAALDEADKIAREPPKEDKPPRKADNPTPSEPPKTEQPKREQPQKDPPSKEEPKKDPPAKETPRKDLPKKEPPKRDLPKKETPKPDPPKKETPAEPPVRSTGLFPRRALAISINNYLFLNPINYGAPTRKSNSVRTLLERFTTGLKVPMEQVFELSDGALMGRARPPVKAAIEKAVTDFVATSRPQDRIIILLVAHTVDIGDEAYIIPLEGDQETKDALIPLTWLYSKLSAASARQKILILDTCRFNPTRGQERPGGAPMGENLDAKLKEPPPGVQVWTACVAGQQSYEFDSSANGNVNNGLFLDCLQQALLHGIEGTIQRPDEPIRPDLLVNKVNSLMKTELATLKLEQTSRLSGKETEGGAAYDSTQAPAAKISIDMMKPTGDTVAALPDVRSILKEIDVPPLKLTRDDMLMRAESMPPFSAKVLAQYKDDGERTPFRQAVEKARQALHEQLKGKQLQEEWLLIGDENRHKIYVKEYQEKEVARTMRELEEALDDLRQAGKEGRKEEKSKRWQANYDYILARLQSQIAYLYEYNSALGDMRKDLPERGPNGWRLASQKKLSGDPAGRKLMTESSKLLDKLAKDHAGTPWEVLAKRDRLSNLGLKWQPNK